MRASQYQQYQGQYPNYGYQQPYTPPPKSGGGIPAFIWIAVGAGVALLFNKVCCSCHASWCHPRLRLLLTLQHDCRCRALYATPKKA